MLLSDCHGGAGAGKTNGLQKQAIGLLKFET
jgi:hypothetical protein